jgi:hypothetical protein
MDSRFKHHFASDPSVFLAKVSSWIKEGGEQDEVVNPLDDENLFIERGPPAKRSFFDSLAAIASSSIISFISKLFLICSIKAILCPK